MRTRRNVSSFVALLTAIAGFTVLDARSVANATSVMIWPVDPVLESRDKATALWLENRGTDAVSLQIRVFGWRQYAFKDQYLEQQREILASPPLATIAPGRRQLVRLIRMSEASADRELAYRVLVDEIPVPSPNAAAQTAPPTQAIMGVRFRMRYSVPLFVYGAGARRDEAARGRAADGGGRTPDLRWRLEDDAGQRYLYIRNDGPVHARLSDVRAHTGAGPIDLCKGLFGYVLPNAEMRWPVKADPPIDPSAALDARVNNAVVAVRPY